MKNKVFIVTFLFSSIISIAQNIDDIGKIALSVVMPTNTDKLKPSEFAKLESKIQQLTAKNGVSGSDYSTNFVIAPKLEIFENEVLNSGLSVKTYIKGELSLYVSQVNNSLIFNTTTISIKGVGENKDKAILNAISHIDVNSKELNSFFTEAKEKIIQYYEINCEQISNKADALIKKQEYNEAIGLLMSVPEEVSSCHQKIQVKSVEAYLAYQNNRCNQTILLAKTQIASKDLYTALISLTDIDSKSSCFKDAEILISKIEKEYTAISEREYKDNKELISKEFEERKLRYQTEEAIESSRINAIKEIAMSYYQNRNQRIPNSTYIIR
jgi:hypothetical protein